SGVDPRPVADPVARVDCWRIRRWRCAEIGAPGPIGTSDGGRTQTTERICSREPCEVAAKAATGAGHEERHRGHRRGHILRLRRYRDEHCDDEKRLMAKDPRFHAVLL